jgi:hypothetical protein
VRRDDRDVQVAVEAAEGKLLRRLENSGLAQERGHGDAEAVERHEDTGGGECAEGSATPAAAIGDQSYEQRDPDQAEHGQCRKGSEQMGKHRTAPG